MVKHTPGPWNYELDAHGRGRIKSDSGCWVGTTWTTADDNSDVRYPAEENAKLIAAAPRLLNVCRMLLNAYDENEGDGIDWEDIDYVVEAAREAVDKAEGDIALDISTGKSR